MDYFGNEPVGSGSGRSRPALVAGVWITAFVLLLGGFGLGVVYLELNGNLKGIDINGVLGGDRPEDADNGSLDILLLGSDSRAGENGAYGDDDGTARSDTAMVVHVHEGHRRATVVSIPRDTRTYRPPCARSDGGTAPAEANAMFNDSYSVGGPACAVKTAESMTGIRMDHYMEIDFTGFTELVDALGGVPLTVDKPIHDRRSKLDLEAGRHVLDGEQSLAFVRTRHGVGDGSDLGRIELQHRFVAALLDRVEELGVLTSPARLYDVADAATKCVTTDSELASVEALAGLGRSMRRIGSEDVDMLTLPVRHDPGDPNRVVPLTKGAQEVWTALRADRRVPASATEGSAAARGGTSASGTPAPGAGE
ncbi:LCP family protein [Streptomyces thermolineatus]|uniref:LCP family protein n=1 Tax=Streptomyces thermolineatus TaxID=44033 RepID=A0ABN3KUU7_9ACTN